MSETSQTCGENAVEMERQSVMYGLCTAVSVAPEFGGADVDKVKLGEPGWKERYYAEKFPAVTEDERKELIKDAVLKYTEGICWVMHYYYQGVCSWQWYYPYHYAPFASDFHGLDQIGIQFTLGVPFKPFTQLMGVLPAASAHALPISYQQLMADPMSPIADFYPSDFEVDMNGKRFAWQGIPKLPFIEEFRLLEEIAKVEHTLMDEEKQRNSVGIEILFVHTSHPLAMEILSLYRRDLNYPRLPEASVKEKIDFKISDGMNGYVYISDKVVCPPLIAAPVEGMENIAGSQVISVFYELPCVHAHVPRLPEGVIIPKKLVTKRDLTLARVLWHEDSALHGRVTLKRPVPNSVSGAYLGRLAHQLVKKFYKHQERESVTPANLKFAFSNVFGGLSKEMCTNGINNNNNTCGNKRTERECHSKDETEAKGVAPLKRTSKEVEGTHKGSEYDGEIKMETESLPCGEKTREQANGMSKGSEYPDNGQMNGKRRRAWKQLDSAGKEGECNCSGRTEVRKREEANHMREMEYRDNGEMKAESLPCGEKATEQTNSMRKGSGEHSSSEMKAKRRRKRARKQADGPRKNGECKGISETEASTREEADGLRKEKEYHDNLERNTESQPCSEKTWEHVDGMGKESEYHSKNEMKAKSRRKRVMKEADGKKDEDCNGNSETEARAREEANDVRKETEYYKNGELKTASLPCGEEARELEESMRKGREYHRNSKAEAKRRRARKPSDGVRKEAGCKGNSEAESVRKRAWEEADEKEKEHHWNG
ncbi:hypothetical protein AMTR_s00025p00023010 [Amborella trichopoda]|uniref:Xrn1 helical domain-containing protein n=2 Tax=Amborella trichopoda TaxID=13333 RepID=W1PXV7_AMBTC|nr:hypothetical protein AMTR_s00025p00023010 [Amborella trichopoda]